MSKMANYPDNAADLRTEAETRWHKRQAGKPAPPPDADTQRLLHELEVHQIELEMQNDELRRARAEAEAALGKFTELYDFAPVGYLTLDRQGGIREANLAGAATLGANRSAMANWQFGFFVCPADRPAGNPQRRKLLVMDDEEPVRELCGKALQMMGHEVELVENGQSAIETYRMARKQGRPFDAVFLDLTIRNGLGGRETIPALRQIESCVKAVVMSGYAGDPVMEEHVRHGFAGALVKPFGIEKLRNVLSQVLGNEYSRKIEP
jgi:CheY-like chemotaxis protein